MKFTQKIDEYMDCPVPKMFMCMITIMMVIITFAIVIQGIRDENMNACNEYCFHHEHCAPLGWTFTGNCICQNGQVDPEKIVF